MTASSLRGMLATSLAQYVGVISSAHTSRRILLRWVSEVGWWEATFLFIWAQQFSMTFRSGEFDGQLERSSTWPPANKPVVPDKPPAHSSRPTANSNTMCLHIVCYMWWWCMGIIHHHSLHHSSTSRSRPKDPLPSTKVSVGMLTFCEGVFHNSFWNS